MHSAIISTMSSSEVPGTTWMSIESPTSVGIGSCLLIFKFVFSCLLHFLDLMFVFFCTCSLYFWDMYSYLFCFYFACFRNYFGFFLEKHKISKNYTLHFFVFSLLPKMHLVFFCIPFLHKLHFVLLYFSFFDMLSNNNTASPPMYVVFPFCWRFLPPHGCIFFLFWACIFWHSFYTYF